MEILIIILAAIFYLALLAYPIFGAIQVFITFIKYFEKDRHPDYYNNIRRYFGAVLAYFLFGFFLINPANNSVISEVVILIYLFPVSAMIALYNRYIMKKNYFEEIEKLIF